MSTAIADDRGSGTDSAPSDAALAQQALEHPDAFAVLYQRYRMRVYRYLRARLPGDEDAADLTQQAFVRAFGQLRQYRADKASFATWLLAIARYAATDFQRRHRTTVEWDGLRHAASADDRDLTFNVVRHCTRRRLTGSPSTPSSSRELRAQSRVRPSTSMRNRTCCRGPTGCRKTNPGRSVWRATTPCRSPPFHRTPLDLERTEKCRVNARSRGLARPRNHDLGPR
jgi:RNA polymerase sigma factor (sigma-70 family)